MSEPLPEYSSQAIALNLDTAERDSKEIREPFAFVVGGRQLVLSDPADLDWQVVNAIDDEVEYLKSAMKPDDLEHFLAQPIPLWKIEQLGRKYQEHYGAGEPGKAGRSGS